MAKISVLGLGAMGARMAANLIKAGHEVTVWNRTAARADSLLEAGAKWAETPRKAAEGAEFVMTMVRDNEASCEVWLDPEHGALAGLGPNAVGIESSTVTRGWVIALAMAFGAAGRILLEAPVSGSRPQAEAGELIYLVGGDAGVLAKTEAVLRAMGNAVHHVGPLGAGALAKLATNTLMGIQTTALAELCGMIARKGGDVERIMGAVSRTAVWSGAASRALPSILQENYAPLFPAELIEKDFRYCIEEAGGPDKAPTLEGARKDFRAAMDAGDGDKQMTVVARLFK